MLCPVVASSIFKWRCYNTFMRCCVTCTFTTLQAISYVIMHFKCFIVACFVLDIYGYFGVLLTWRLLFTTLVCPTHSSHYRTNVLFTMSRIIFCHYVACSWFALDILWLPFFTGSLVGACIAQLSYAIVECLGYSLSLSPFYRFHLQSPWAQWKPAKNQGTHPLSLRVLQYF